ncbi:serine hydrolase domain-containing protein [Actinokineospora pegani]|uniref:serine hydrolase domain-containing protein n=1 Tax=Actinokineospora pegani TaxID=2654637 RepID=UPI0018D4B1D5|nr:serine hydrolase domain-containing protein [Actinokineospora pegani]
MRRLLVVVLAGLAVAGFAVAPAGADPVPDVLGEYRLAMGSLGAAQAVRDGDTVVGAGSGRTTLFGDTALDEDTRFRVGSQTKMTVATVVLQLVDEGELTLDDTVAQHLPGVLSGDGVDPAAITVRHLLTHRSGVPDYLGYLGGDYLQIAQVLFNPVWQISPPSPQQLIDSATPKGADFAAGTDGAYSNTGYTLLGMIVEQVTGRSIGTEVTERVITPAGMSSSFYAEAGQKALPAPFARGYIAYAGYPLADYTGFEPAIWGAAAALVSTGEDMTRFLTALLTGELLSPARLADMRDVQPLPGIGDYGLGLKRFDTACGTAWGHSGHVAGYSTFTVGRGDKAVALNVNVSAVGVDTVSAGAARQTIIDAALCG